MRDPDVEALVTADAPTPYPPTPAGPPQYLPPPAPKTEPMAIAGLILAFFMWPVGLVLSIIALRRTKAPGTGRGLAIAGLIVSIVEGLATIALVVFLVVLGSSVVGPTSAANQLSSSLMEADCEAFQAVTTATYQEGMACADFEAAAAAFSESVEDYSFTVVNVSVEGDTATVDARETYTDTTTGEAVDQTFTISLVQQGGDWLVDSTT